MAIFLFCLPHLTWAQEALYWLQKAEILAEGIRPDSALYYLQKTDPDAPENAQLKPRIDAAKGIAYLYRSQYDTAASYLESARCAALAMQDTVQLSRMTYMQAMIKLQMGHFESANELLLQSARLNSRIGADSLNARVYFYIGVGYDNMGDLDQFIHYVRKARQLADVHQLNKEQIRCSFAMALYYSRSEQRDSVFHVLTRAQKLLKKVNDPLLESYTYLNLAYHIGGPLGEQHFLRAIHTPNLAPYHVCNARMAYGNHLLDISNYSGAAAQAQEVLQITRDIKSHHQQVDALYILMKAAEGKELYRQAYEYAQEYQVLKDSIYTGKLRERISELNVQYETAVKEKENQTLLAENAQKDLRLEIYAGQMRKHLWWMSFLVVAAASLVYIFFQRVRLSQKNKEILRQDNKLKEEALQRLTREKEIEVLTAKMKGEEMERFRIARELHDGLGAVIAAIKLSLTAQNNFDKKGAVDLVDRASNELREIAQNLHPDNLCRFGLFAAIEDLCNDMSTPQTTIHFQKLQVEESELKPIEVPLYRMVQELVANCIRHARASEVLVQFSKSSCCLNVVVEDDGEGITDPPVDGKMHLGLSNIRSRLAPLNGQMQIDSKAGCGTSVNLEIPLPA